MLREIEGRLYEHCLQANFQDNCKLKGMLVDGAMLHCIPQERWTWLHLSAFQAIWNYQSERESS